MPKQYTPSQFRSVLKMFCMSGLVLSQFAQTANAQTLPKFDPPLPEHRNIDQNGVELGWTSFREVATHSSIGSSENGLKRVFYSALESPDGTTPWYGAYNRDNFYGYIGDGTTDCGYDVRIGDNSECFNGTSGGNLPELTYNGEVGFYRSTKHTKGGALFSFDNGNKYRYINSSGDEYIFDNSIIPQSFCANTGYYNGCGVAYLVKIKKSSGEVIDIYHKPDGQECWPYAFQMAFCGPRIAKVVSNYGYALEYTYNSGGDLTAVTAVNRSVANCDANETTCISSYPWQKWEYWLASNECGLFYCRRHRIVTDPMAKAFSYKPREVVYPSGLYKKIRLITETSALTSFVETNAPVDFYVVRPEGTWKYARMFTDIYNHVESVDDGGFGYLDIWLTGNDPYTQVTDPLGRSTKFYFSNEGLAEARFYVVSNELLQLTHKSFHIGPEIQFSELQSIVNSKGGRYGYGGALITETDPLGVPLLFNGQPVKSGSLVQRGGTSTPEGAQTEFEFDGRANITKKKYISKNGLSTIEVNIGYPTACANVAALVTCNKPSWFKDPKNNQTDYTYDSVHGGILTETGPADANGIRPQKRYEYTAKYAKVKNGSGTLVNAEGPIYKLTKTSTCASSTNSCAGTADELVTTYEYDSNNLLQTAVTVRAGNDTSCATTACARTEYGYDDYGNVVSVDGPLSGADDKSYVTYDLLRRKVFEIGGDPDGNGALKRVAVKHFYSDDGNEVRTESGTCDAITFSSVVPTGCSDFAVKSYKIMTYDSAGRLTKTAVGQP